MKGLIRFVLLVVAFNAGVGAQMVLHGKQSQPAPGDVAGNIRAIGTDAAGNDIIVGEIYFVYDDIAPGTGPHPGAAETAIIFATDEEYRTHFPLMISGDSVIYNLPDNRPVLASNQAALWMRNNRPVLAVGDEDYICYE